MGKRELGIVDYVTYGKEDHDILTCSIGIDFDGSHQGFGGLCLDEKVGPDFVNSICELFDVSFLKDIVGKKVYALRCFSDWNAH